MSDVAGGELFSRSGREAGPAAGCVPWRSAHLVIDSKPWKDWHFSPDLLDKLQQHLDKGESSYGRWSASLPVSSCASNYYTQSQRRLEEGSSNRQLLLLAKQSIAAAEQSVLVVSLINYT